MRYKLVADLHGELFARGTDLTAEREGFLFELLAGPDGRINKVAASMKVPPDRVDGFSGSIIPGEGRVKASIHIGGDKELHAALIRQLQMLESELAVATRGAVWRVSWDVPSKEFLPESPEEGDLLPITAVSYAREYPPTRALISSNEFRILVAGVPSQYPLQVAKAFWREAMNALRTFQYIQAFYWFFFIIEDFYASGKTGERPFVRQLNSSAEFRRIPEDSLGALRAQPRHQSSIDAFFLEERLPATAASLPTLLFRFRGRLHHYTSRSPKSQPTPFNQDEFESMALLAMHIASTSVALRGGLAQTLERGASVY